MSTLSSSSSKLCKMMPLHEDVVFQILLRLPVASLLRFRCVCKSWLFIIDSPAFISQHARLGEDDTFIVSEASHSSRRTFNFIPIGVLGVPKRFEFPQIDDGGFAQYGGVLVGCCNGVVCLTERIWIQDAGIRFLVDSTSLWNPATKELTTLPRSQFWQFYNMQNIDLPISHSEHGLGFDVKTNDYKVVRVSLKEDFKEQKATTHIEVYSLSKDCWRVLDVFLPIKFFTSFNPGMPFKNGIYCWLVYDYSKRAKFVLSFDFSDEVFGIMPLPEPCTRRGDERLHVLTFLREKIAYIDWIDAPEHQISLRYDVWVLDEYGVKESWTKLYTIVLGQETMPSIFLMDGKLVFLKEEDHGQNLCIYDPLTKEVNDVLSFGTVFEVVTFKESLISVKSANGVPKNQLGWLSF